MAAPQQLGLRAILVAAAVVGVARGLAPLAPRAAARDALRRPVRLAAGDEGKTDYVDEFFPRFRRDNVAGAAADDDDAVPVAVAEEGALVAQSALAAAEKAGADLYAEVSELRRSSKALSVTLGATRMNRALTRTASGRVSKRVTRH